MSDRDDGDLIRRLTGYLHRYSTYPYSGQPRPERPLARGHRTLVVAAAVNAIGFAAGHASRSPRHQVAAIPSATGTMGPTIAATPSAGPTTVTPTPARTPTPGQVVSAIETYALPSLGEGQQVNSITAGPNGDVWFAWGDPSGTAGGIGSITVGGAISLFPVPPSDAGPVNDLAWGGGYLWTLEEHGGHSYIG